MFYNYPITFQSPNGSFEMRRLSTHVWVCISNSNHKLSQSWPEVEDFDKKFVVYIGFDPRIEPFMETWVNKLRSRVRFHKTEVRNGKADRTGMPRECRFWGIRANDALLLAQEDNLPF